jgi:hypothetical protein
MHVNPESRNDECIMFLTASLKIIHSKMAPCALVRQRKMRLAHLVEIHVTLSLPGLFVQIVYICGSTVCKQKLSNSSCDLQPKLFCKIGPRSPLTMMLWFALYFQGSEDGLILIGEFQTKQS